MSAFFGVSQAPSETSPDAQAVTAAIAGLQRFSALGYDLYGVVGHGATGAAARKEFGHVEHLSQLIEQFPLEGHACLGQAQWSMGGRLDLPGAYPRPTKRLSLVFKGLVSNLNSLRNHLTDSMVPLVDTDAGEVIINYASLVLEGEGTPQRALVRLMADIKGAFALAAIFHEHEGLILASQKDAELYLGHLDEGSSPASLLSSELIGLGPSIHAVQTIEHGEIAALHRGHARVYDLSGQERLQHRVQASQLALARERSIFPDPVLKEIHDQPSASMQIIRQVDDLVRAWSTTRGQAAIDQIVIVAQGPSLALAQFAAASLERALQRSVTALSPFGFIYGQRHTSVRTLVCLVDETGESEAMIEALDYARQEKIQTLAVTHDASSRLAQSSDHRMVSGVSQQISPMLGRSGLAQLASLLALEAILAPPGEHGKGGPSTLLDALTANIDDEIRQGLSLALHPRLQDFASLVSSADQVLVTGLGEQHALAALLASNIALLTELPCQAVDPGELRFLGLSEARKVVLLALTDGSGRDDVIVDAAENLAHAGCHIAFVGPGAGEGHLEMDRCSPMGLMLKSWITGQLLAYYAAIRMGHNFNKTPAVVPSRSAG